ncbi:DNA-binding protein YbaB [Streptomyces sp. SAI-117]|uniref:YbaB/EbfC family nucleoid-associated protein n=1 Tax=Streptomyces sp. SAI-117 TaxID=2940546 RepID=UPI0024736A74|nr:YbaB/EbfC family nucleoid-associated protein [Streptomyces sp. SAI-117]MDH6573835.1 DNA-binding protein YbaB [Streptomyces sp. SAI-117]
MTEPLEKRVEKAMAELQAAQAAMERTERELRQVSFAVLSSDRAVRATVGPQGEVTALDFLDDKYRDMSPQELAASVLEAINAARVKVNRHVMKALTPFTQPSDSMPELEGFDVDWGNIFGPEVLEDDGDDANEAEKKPGWRDALEED